MSETGKESLGCVQAICEAAFGRPITYFPRSSATGSAQATINDGTVIATIEQEIEKIAADDAKLDDALKLARDSLNEVTKHTDYQDGKATRLLTIVTFMSAFASLLFNRFADGYPFSVLSWSGAQQVITSGLIIASYCLFAVFALLAAFGALVTFHAIRSRFRYPTTTSAEHPGSLVFWMPISWTEPKNWARAFIDLNDSSKITPDIKVKYLKNYIVETYLVGVKVADKVRVLEPAQRLQSWAIKALILWIAVTALVFAFVPPAKKESNSVIRIETPISSVCVTGGNNVSTAANGQPCATAP